MLHLRCDVRMLTDLVSKALIRASGAKDVVAEVLRMKGRKAKTLSALQ